MATQELNLEQSDFAAGLVTDANPLIFPPNATLDEDNFDIERDGSRSRRKGVLLERDVAGSVITQPANFYSEPYVESAIYSTISPKGEADPAAYSFKLSDVITITDNSVSEANIRCYSADNPELVELPISIASTLNSPPYVVTQHSTYQAYTSVRPSGSPSNIYQVGLLYGGTNPDILPQQIRSTATHSIQYKPDASSATIVPVSAVDANIADAISWGGRLVYAFNSSDGSRGHGIGISALPDPLASAEDQAADLGKCYDQSSGSTPLSTSGSWVFTGDLGSMRKLVPFRNGIMVFTDDSIWYLNTNTGYFDPYDFNFDKISITRIAGKHSIVAADKSIFFWSESGIHAIYPDENTGLPALDNVSEGRIQKLFDTFTPLTINNARGVYNKEKNNVRWLYSDDPLSFDNSRRQRFDRELVLDLAKAVFTKNSFAGNEATHVTDYIPDRAADLTFENATIITSGSWTTPFDTIVDSTGEELYAVNLIGYELTSSYKYVIRDDATVKLGALQDDTFTDFRGSISFPEGTDPVAYIKSGYYTFNDTQRDKTPNYLTTTFYRTESGYDPVNDKLLTPSSCKLTAYFDFANDNFTGKVHGPYQAYRMQLAYMPEDNDWSYGQDYVSTKNKIRGRGKTIQFKFETDAGKDCRLYAWGFNGNMLTRV